MVCAGAVYLLNELALFLDHLVTDFGHCLTGGAEHFENVNGIGLVTAELELFSCTFSEDVLPGLAVLVVPREIVGQLENVPVQAQGVAAGGQPLGDKEVGDRPREYLKEVEFGHILN